MLYLHCRDCHLTIGTSHLTPMKSCPRCGGVLMRRPRSLFAQRPPRKRSLRHGSPS
jgi:hypothetical protein